MPRLWPDPVNDSDSQVSSRCLGGVKSAAMTFSPGCSRREAKSKDTVGHFLRFKSPGAMNKEKSCDSSSQCFNPPFYSSSQQLITPKSGLDAPPKKASVDIERTAGYKILKQQGQRQRGQGNHRLRQQSNVRQSSDDHHLLTETSSTRPAADLAKNASGLHLLN